MTRAFLALALFLAACPPTPPPVPPPGAATCADFCAHLSRLGCEAAKPTPEGATCTDVCLNLQTSGVIARDLDCAVRTQSCAAVDACPAKP
jgi:hypothetical protein